MARGLRVRHFLMMPCDQKRRFENYDSPGKGLITPTYSSAMVNSCDINRFLFGHGLRFDNGY